MKYVICIQTVRVCLDIGHCLVAAVATAEFSEEHQKIGNSLLLLVAFQASGDLPCTILLVLLIFEPKCIVVYTGRCLSVYCVSCMFLCCYMQNKR